MIMRVRIVWIVVWIVRILSKQKKTDIVDREKRLIELIENNPTITQVKMVERLKWNLPVVKYYIKSLKEKSILVRTGTVHNGRWTYK